MKPLFESEEVSSYELDEFSKCPVCGCTLFYPSITTAQKVSISAKSEIVSIFAGCKSPKCAFNNLPAIMVIMSLLQSKEIYPDFNFAPFKLYASLTPAGKLQIFVEHSPLNPI